MNEFLTFISGVVVGVCFTLAFTASTWGQTIKPAQFNRALKVCAEHGGLRRLDIGGVNDPQAVCEDNSHFYAVSLEVRK